MSMETYKDKLAKADLYEKLAEAENQIKNGEKLLDAEAVFKSLKDRYGKRMQIDWKESNCGVRSMDVYGRKMGVRKVVSLWRYDI